MAEVDPVAGLCTQPAVRHMVTESRECLPCRSAFSVLVNELLYINHKNLLENIFLAF